jgi:hypothetical protein
VPWGPELFTAAALERVAERHRREHLVLIPFYLGLMTGEIDAIIGSFAGEPDVHHPVRGRIRGAEAFERYAAETTTWLAERDATVEDVGYVITPGRRIEETVLRLDGDDGATEVPVALAAERDGDRGITELRIYFSTWPLTGHHAIRPPLLQPDGGLHAPDVVGDYQRALAAGDAEAAVAAFEPGAYVREPAGGDHVYRGTDGLRALYERFFSNGGGIPLEHCAVTDDGRACALEYNVVAWGRTAMAPQAGLAVYVRGDSGRLAAARIYDDADPPLRWRGT